jgi:hypothetical protein
MTPRGLEPGYEMRLSKKSLFTVYGAVALGLALPGIVAQLQRRKARTGMAPAPYIT